MFGYITCAKSDPLLLRELLIMLSPNSLRGCWKVWVSFFSRALKELMLLLILFVEDFSWQDASMTRSAKLLRESLNADFWWEGETKLCRLTDLLLNLPLLLYLKPVLWIRVKEKLRGSSLEQSREGAGLGSSWERTMISVWQYFFFMIDVKFLYLHSLIKSH